MSALCAGSGLLMPVESRASKVVFLETSCGENHTEPRRVLVACQHARLRQSLATFWHYRPVFSDAPG